jgi:hypothetical protein
MASQDPRPKRGRADGWVFTTWGEALPPGQEDEPVVQKRLAQTAEPSRIREDLLALAKQRPEPIVAAASKRPKVSGNEAPPATRSQRRKALFNDPDFYEAHQLKMKEVAQRPERRAKASAAMRKRMEDPNVRLHQSTTAAEAWKDPTTRSKHSESAKALWRDPDFKAKMDAPETRRKQRETLGRYRQDPSVRAKMSVSGRRAWQNPVVRERRTSGLRRAFANQSPEQKADFLAKSQSDASRKKRAESLKAYWANPENRKRRSERMREALNNPRTRKAMSKASRKRWADPADREKMIRGLRRVNETA